jgi:hypothetical protein
MDDQSATPLPATPLLPGVQPDKQLAFLYVEARAGETALAHLRWTSGAYRAALKVGAVSPPAAGMLGTTSWWVETPEGVRFYGLQVGGDRAAWLAALRHCARAAGRAAAEVVGYTRIPARFVLDDGRTLELAECRCGRE